MPAKSPMLTHRSWGLDSPKIAEGAGLCTPATAEAWHLMIGPGRTPGAVRLTEDNEWALRQCQRCPVQESCLVRFSAQRKADRRSQIAGGVVWNSDGEPARAWHVGDPTGNKSPHFNPQTCGTYAAARRHQDRGEVVDEACREAIREWDRQYRRRRRARVEDGEVA